ncbi:MAG: translocation/assembly module TamB domain-containing protein [Paludibacteraceae bacterium]|nr:translocation/assembly module TamB domain-containing protein [Paludibacteraceae bacterium]
MPKDIKKSTKIIVLLVAIPLIVLATIPIVLQSSAVQNYIARLVTKSLSETLETKVTIGTVNYKLFNRISINDIYVEDRQKDTLIFVEKAYVGFSVRQLFNSRLSFHAVEFKKPVFHLKADSTGTTNLDFILKALKNDSTNDSSKVEYRIRKLDIKDAVFSFTRSKAHKANVPGVFNPDSIWLSNLDMRLFLNVLKNDSLNVDIPSLSFTERSGFRVDELSTHIIASDESASVGYLNLLMPDSKIKFAKTELLYDSLGAFSNYIHKVRWNIPVEVARVAFSDIRYLVPGISGLNNTFRMTGLISGRVSSLKFQDFELGYGKDVAINANLELSGLPNIDETFVYADIKEMRMNKADVQDVISSLSRKPFVLPTGLNQLGTVKYSGNITGFFSNLVAYGNIATNIGSISTDILLKFDNHLRDLTYNGTVKSRNLQLDKLLPGNKLGKTAFVINTNGTKKENEHIRGNVKAVFNEIRFNDYTYSDIKLDGKYDGTGFNGNIDLKDDNISADFSGEIDLTKKLPVFDFKLLVENANLHALNFIKGYKDATLTFRGSTNMVGNSPDNMNGFVSFDSIIIVNNHKSLNISEIYLASRTAKDFSNFSIRSDFANGSFTGNFKYSSVGSSIKNIIHCYLPVLSGEADDMLYGNHIDMDLRIDNTLNFCDVFELPYRISGVSTIKGSIDEKMNKVDLRAFIPTFVSGKTRFENISLDVQNLQKELKLTSRAQMLDKNGMTSMYLLAGASQDSVSTQIGWQNSREITNAGEFQTVTRFRKEEGKTLASMSVLPTQIIVSDSIWDIRASKIDFRSDTTISVRNFRIDNERQFININGLASARRSDSLIVSTNDLNLDYIMQIVKLKGISIGGFVTGKINLFSLLKQPVFLADLDVRDVAINNMIVSDAKLSSTWDNEQKKVLLGAHFIRGADTVALANGHYNPVRDSIDVVFDVNSLSIVFLQKYFAGVAENVQGEGKGIVRMFGPMKRIGFEGDVFVDKAQATIDMLKTTYYFNDTVRLTKNAIHLQDILVFDAERNQGTLNGLINHDGGFGNMKYNVNIAARNLLAMNTQAADNEYFFGKAYATGTVNIFGDVNEANIVVNAVSRPGSKGSIQMGGASTASDNNFISFVNPRVSNSNNEITEEEPEQRNKFNVKVDLQIEVTPDAQMELLVDPRAGDVISGRGNGNLRVQFDSFSDLKLFGTYTIDDGYYLFTLQTLIRKEFKIDRGSTISWTGDPFDAKVDIRAKYSLTAPLSDLLDDVGNTTNRGNVPVDCVLLLTDDLMKPAIKFDIDLPSSDEGVKQKVRAVINTEESMNRQIASLLFLNRFFMPSNVTEQNPNAGWNQSISLLTNTLSTQVNSWVQKSLNMNNLSVGIDVVTQTESDEYKALLNYQPNKRIVINGNIGYRDDNIATTTSNSKIIGDFDFEYLLTESGKLRFKAYSHTVDRELLKEARSTQGLGLAYKEDFQSVSEMMKYYGDFFKRLFKTNKNEKK